MKREYKEYFGNIQRHKVQRNRVQFQKFSDHGHQLKIH